MSNLDQSALILSLALALKANGSWAGETHVQKAGYFLDSFLNVPTNLHYILYKHGPFSFDLRELLTGMEANGFIKWIAQPPYGPSIGEGQLGPILRSKFSTLTERYKDQIAFVAEHLGSRNVANLERIATALYVEKEGYSASTRVSRIVALKPHVEIPFAEKAVEELDRLRTLASARSLIIGQ